jgi:hypothetical protein
VLTNDELKLSSWLTLLLLQCTSSAIKSCAIWVFSVPMSVGFLVKTNLNMCNDKDFSRWNKKSLGTQMRVSRDFNLWNKIWLYRFEKNATKATYRLISTQCTKHWWHWPTDSFRRIRPSFTSFFYLPPLIIGWVQIS